MADIRCSHCGEINPDFFDNCQFCQSPLKSESMLHTGEEPQKLDTGELEQILPPWLQDARKQNRMAAEEEATKASATKPKVQKSEPLDLLAGLASQSDSDDEDVPDWLTSISPVAKQTPAAQEETPSDFFSQFEKKETKPSEPSSVEPEQEEETPDWMQEMSAPAPEQQDQLGDRLSQTSAEKTVPDSEPTAGDNTAWINDFGAFTDAQQESPAEKEPEDLGWLHDLEAASKQTDELPPLKPGEGLDVPSQPASSHEDLSWLDNLGGSSEPSLEEPTPDRPAPTQDDLGWLDNLGGTPAPPFEGTTFEQPSPAQGDLSWLDNLGGTSTPSFEEPTPRNPTSSQEDLSWLNFGDVEQTPASEQPTTPAFADDMDWMKNLGEQDDTQTQEKPQFSPRTTAPLDENALKDTTPDWLKSAMAEPSMPAPGELSMDWFSEHEKPSKTEQPTETPDSFEETTASSFDELFASDQDKPASTTDFELPFSDTPDATPQDAETLFGADMPDWLSRTPEGAEATPFDSASTAGDESLAPVELPSWVQAMRPVDSAIGDLSASDVDQITEREGPLAGFRGVIPFAPIGSSLRPKALLLKLQATDEHQAGATLIEQIINGESALHSPSKKTAAIASQRMVRWILTGLFIIVLSLVIGSGTQSMPIYASATVNELSNHIATLPENPQVLVVIDYEPSLAGELEAAAGSMFEQLAVSRRSTFTFISMTPNGSGLVERLMSNTDLGYQAGVQYFNSGFLPGGSAGVLGFIENPRVMPGVNTDAFSNFEAVILMTDNSESSRVWVEQLDVAKGSDPLIASKPLFMVSSAQAGPIMQPYISSGQVDVMISGMPAAVQYEYVNNTRLRTARSYWDAFGIGLTLAIMSIVLGSLWNLFVGIRERRVEAEQE